MIVFREQRDAMHFDVNGGGCSQTEDDLVVWINSNLRAKRVVEREKVRIVHCAIDLAVCGLCVYSLH